MDTTKEKFNEVLTELKRKTYEINHIFMRSGWVYMHQPTRVWTRRDARYGTLCSYIEWGLSVYPIGANKGIKIHLEEFVCTNRDLDSEGKQQFYYGNKRSIIDYKDRKIIRNSAYHRKKCFCQHRYENDVENLHFDKDEFIRDVNSNDRYHPLRRELFW